MYADSGCRKSETNGGLGHGWLTQMIRRKAKEKKKKITMKIFNRQTVSTKALNKDCL